MVYNKETLNISISSAKKSIMKFMWANTAFNIVLLVGTYAWSYVMHLMAVEYDGKEAIANVPQDVLRCHIPMIGICITILPWIFYLIFRKCKLESMCSKWNILLNIMLVIDIAMFLPTLIAALYLHLTYGAVGIMLCVVFACSSICSIIFFRKTKKQLKALVIK